MNPSESPPPPIVNTAISTGVPSNPPEAPNQSTVANNNVQMTESPTLPPTVPVALTMPPSTTTTSDGAPGPSPATTTSTSTSSINTITPNIPAGSQDTKVIPPPGQPPPPSDDVQVEVTLPSEKIVTLVCPKTSLLRDLKRRAIEKNKEAATSSYGVGYAGYQYVYVSEWEVGQYRLVTLQGNQYSLCEDGVRVGELPPEAEPLKRVVLLPSPSATSGGVPATLPATAAAAAAAAAAAGTRGEGVDLGAGVEEVPIVPPAFTSNDLRLPERASVTIFCLVPEGMGKDVQLCLCGSDAELGAWKRAVPMRPHKTLPNLWEIQVTFHPALTGTTRYEFKFVLQTSRLGTYEGHWEDEGRAPIANRHADCTRPQLLLHVAQVPWSCTDWGFRQQPSRTMSRGEALRRYAAALLETSMSMIQKRAETQFDQVRLAVRVYGGISRLGADILETSMKLMIRSDLKLT
ncbi:hypothetical protein PAPYR_9332 [Paratrimastix pyriformis]|uniref:CBM20 domain-containing protein n=1 Tax=Paratrimastix pyriformis TaxID=342808 RepID=A0ABQ8U8P1_9EUKA|nr:hypothetical protein PAPYR_9332 [Paratrimastix pyriformis]